jgi:hypothetical protein
MLLPMILTAFERDAALIDKALRTPEPYLEVIRRAQQEVTNDLRQVRYKFRISGIKVYDEHRDQRGLRAKYQCRGYHHDFQIPMNYAAAESKELMRKYLGLESFRNIKV